MNIYQKFISLAKEKGIEDIQITVNKSSSFELSLYHHEIENYGVNTNITTNFRGIYNGKFGTATCTNLTKDNTLDIIDDITNNSKVIEKNEKAQLFLGSEKYHKVKTYNKDYEKVSLKEKKDLLFNLEKEIEKQSDLIRDVVDVAFSESVGETIIINSNGLNLRQKSNYFVISAGAVVKNESDEQVNYDIFIDNKFENFDMKEFAKNVVNKAIEKLNAKPCESKKMKTIIDRECIATLLSVYTSWCDAEQIQKHVSLFEGKLNTKIASNKLSVYDMPLIKTVYAKWFDDEGVATYNKPIIKNGVLKTYLYTLETAQKDNTMPTGNGVNAGSKIVAAPTLVYVKPSKKSLEELFEKVGNGIYITDLQGAHAGINSTSGDFSLQAQGFLIKDGKKDMPVSLITVSGNILDLFNNIGEIGGDAKLLSSGYFVPSIYFKSLSISGS